jgi:hypothetical protein
MARNQAIIFIVETSRLETINKIKLLRLVLVICFNNLLSDFDNNSHLLRAI